MRKKMVCRILLLITVTSFSIYAHEVHHTQKNISFSQGFNQQQALFVNVTQDVYQAEENDNVTLEWTFTTGSNTSMESLQILCKLLSDDLDSVLYHVRDGVEVPESQDGRFEGRIESDIDALREGLLSLQLFQLVPEDSGFYRCDIRSSYGSDFGIGYLNVTAIVSPLPDILGENGLYIGLLVTAGVVAAAVSAVVLSYIGA
ncbi:V-set and immunoglobulin domain-containing protein 1-like [Synchiropus splendidus]|uniref:V-set and immunoglobulin domain-containing protein 1-like n=1 Tax=Synchiropus splendidus TaxID=270530 RepID=UPI00237EE948|nr:V-set and immunoglobulin domain-containing protein 1-like [Synchiropus splendidus]